jgi:hypothetical protein
MPTSLVLELKQGDTKPAFRAQCLDGTTPVDLTSAATARLVMRNWDDNTTVTGLMTVEDQTQAKGWAHRAWGAGETTTVGYYRAVVQVTWSDGTVQTFPADGYAGVSITANLT